ncbi:MAG: metal-dependent transcriptional regulator [Bacteroidota bacterium]|nr:metal-dependent transcriptional regulator [Bacteroidota bacterium]
MHSLSEENYLKAIYRLGQEGDQKISPTLIAEALNNNPASVIDMLKKLGDKKLVNYDKVKGARLTEKGAKAALDVVRKHRLWEVFLLDKLGYSWDEIHDIAEQLEHVQQSDLADRLDKFLGYPDYDPHGDPIPDKNGKLPGKKSKPLSEVEVGAKVKVVLVADNSTAFLKYLDKQNIGLNSLLTIKEIQEFDKSLLVEIKGKKEIFLSLEAARQIFVE